MKQLHIAMLSYHTCPLASLEGKETGGMNVYVLELSRVLARRGHTVDMFTRAQAADNQEIVPVEDNLRNIHLPGGPKAVLSKADMLRYVRDFASEVQRFMEREKLSYDLLHAHYYMSGLVGLELRKLMHEKFPLIMSFHTLGLLKNLVARSDMEIEDKARIDSEKLLTRVADRIVALSDLDFGYLQYLYNVPKEKLTVIPPGVDTSVFRPLNQDSARDHIGLSRDGKLLLFVGRVERLKGVDLILYTLKILKTKHPGLRVCLMIVGGDVSEKPQMWSKPLRALEELRRELGIEAIVQFVGQKKQSELPYFYNAADVLVMPSHYESFGMVALEAMACGVPVITTDVAGVSSLLDQKHTKLVTTVNNPFLLASHIELILQHRNTDELRKMLRHKVEDLSWDRIAERTERVYRRVLSAKDEYSVSV